ncbi:WG repeat-containing protein [Flammeovirga yaeyamensis]|uniref:WG repeat-containing protein n=1 Tax=Flammeovirga yaeyamensis TaxID=367791 RepID=A0AAX1N103_9BACT|nr:WG repeat-containing protein [Flammeovirga yaeyamensis]MBB3698446.1 hypothetical protein [Flammeovirga yaeyamensis]NMF34204.1 WG repeat-containing protein [Flammeovirga yaeyamensis]QWG01189.1 WG repeat-containing protein [Flammeovirga yaeyamensis]
MSYRISFFLLFLPLISIGQQHLPFVKDGKWGIIDQNNNIVVEANYQCATPLHNFTYFRVGKNNLLGLLSENGKEIFPIVYQRIEYLEDDLFVTWNEKGAFLVNKNHQTLSVKPYQSISPLFPFLRIHHHNKEGILSADGKEIFPPKYQNIEKQQHIFITHDNHQFGFLNSKGEEQVAPKYKSLDFLDENHLVGSIKGGPLKAVYVLDKDGSIQEEKSFNKKSDLLNYQKQLYLKSEAQKVKAANLSVPVWVDILGDKYLVAPTGKVILNAASFFYVLEDQKSELTIARREESEGKNAFYLIDQKKGRPLYKNTFKNIVLDDYNYSDWARITIDTLWDGLVNIEGTVKRQINDNGNDYGIKNMGNFYNQRAWFQTKSGKYGVINEHAEVIIPPIYSVISDFKDGQAIVRKNQSYGIIDTEGKIVIPIEYNGFSKLYDNWYTIKKGNGSLGKWGIIDKNGRFILQCKYEKIYLDDKGANIKQNGKWGRFLKTGKWAFQPKIPVDEMHPYHNSIARLQRKPKYDPIDRKTLIGYQYEGYADENGNIILPPVYQEILGFDKIWEKKEGIAMLRKDQKIGYVNYHGEVVLPTEYIKAENFVNAWSIHKGGGIVVKPGNVYNAVDYNGNELLTEEYDYLSDDFIKIWEDSSGVTIAGFGRKKGLIDFEGNRKSPFVYQKIFPLDSTHFIAQKDNLWGIISSEGDTLSEFTHQNSAPLSGTNKVKYIDRQNQVYKIKADGSWESSTLPPSEKTDDINELAEFTYHIIGEDYAIVSKKGKSKLRGIVDTNGKALSKFEFKKIGPFKEGLAFAQKDGKTAKDRKYGYINKKGKWVINAQYNKAKSFSSGFAAVNIKNKWGFIDLNGKLVLPTKYSQAEDFKGDITEVNHHTLINKEGKEIGQLIDEEHLQKTKNGKGIVKGIGYKKHIFFNGLALYSKKFDDVTVFNKAGIAFVKTGEKWELTRKINKTTVKKMFTKRDMELYISEYGNKRRVVSMTGDVSQDMGFEKKIEGTWRMIGIDGAPLNNINFSKVIYLEEDDSFIIQTNMLEKIVSFDGELLTEEAVMGSMVPSFGGVILFDKGNSNYLK